MDGKKSVNFMSSKMNNSGGNRKTDKDKKDSSIDNKESGEKSKSKIINFKQLKRKLMIIAICAGLFLVFFIVAYLLFAWNTLMTTMVSFFGVKEGDYGIVINENGEEEEREGIWVEDKYLTNEGEPVPLEDYESEDGTVKKEGLITILSKDNGCGTSAIENWFNNIIMNTHDSFLGDECKLLNYIKSLSERRERDNERRYGLNIDENMIISTIFYGYDEQVPVTSHDDPSQAKFVDPSSHYSVLSDIVNPDNANVLKPSDIKKIIDNSIYNEEWNYGVLSIDPETLSGECISKTHKYVYYSPERLEIFLRFGEDVAEEWEKNTNKNNAFINTHEACRGNIPEEEVIKKYGLADFTNTYSNKNISSPLELYTYSQKVQYKDLNTPEEVNIVPSNGKTLDYRDGYIYNTFPAYKKAADSNIEGFEYNSVTTPKKIEKVIQSMFERKEEFNSVLESSKTQGYDGPSKPTSDSTRLDVTSYFNIINESGAGDFEVINNDCNGKYIATRSFKEYILGVTLAEIGYPRNDEYVKTQMVAAISFTLSRGRNNENKTFAIKSGDCDQNWCDIYKGCSRSPIGALVRLNQEKHKDNPILLATFPGTVYNSSNFKTCNVNGAVGYNYFKCPLKPEETTRYSNLFDEAMDYVIVNKNGSDDIKSALHSFDFMGPYNNELQQKWNALANEGKTFVEILHETYPNSIIIRRTDALEEISKMDKLYNSWPDYNEQGIKINKANDLSICKNYNSNYSAEWNNKVVEVAFRLAGERIGDCSTFVSRVIEYASKELGIPVPGLLSSSTYMMQDYGRFNCANYDDLRVGDIIFERTNKERYWFYEVGHVGIFMGYDDSGNQLIFESNSNNSSGKYRGLSDPNYRPALVIDNNIHRIAGYVRWYPPASASN